MDEIVVEIPTRLDFAGGTLDIYPLYLLFDGVSVVNLAIDILTMTEIIKNDSLREPLLRSQDLDFETSYSDLDAYPDLSFHKAIIDYFNLENMPIILTTKSQAPIGSGLGASSSLLISMVTAVSEFLSKDYTPREIIQIAKDIETSQLKIPTGIQDYYAAIHRGLSAIHLYPGKVEYEDLNEYRQFIDQIMEQMHLIYLGRSHHSAKENWNIYKHAIEADRTTIDNLEALAALSYSIYQTIINNDTQRFIQLVTEEWEYRKRLLDTMEIEQMKQIIEDLGDIVLGVKGCGAAGGGSMIIFAESNAEAEIKTICEKHGASLLSFLPFY